MPSYREMLITHLCSQSELGLSPFPLDKIMSLHICYYAVHYQTVNMNILETGLWVGERCVLIYKEACSLGYVSVWGSTYPWQIVAVGRREKTPVNFHLFPMHIFVSFIRNTLHLVIFLFSTLWNIQCNKTIICYWALEVVKSLFVYCS